MKPTVPPESAPTTLDPVEAIEKVLANYVQPHRVGDATTDVLNAIRDAIREVTASEVARALAETPTPAAAPLTVAPAREAVGLICDEVTASRLERDRASRSPGPLGGLDAATVEAQREALERIGRIKKDPQGWPRCGVCLRPVEFCDSEPIEVRHQCAGRIARRALATSPGQAKP